MRNAGSGTDLLTVTGATAQGASFGLVAGGLPQTLAAGQAVDLTVTFDPTQGGNVAGSITVDSSDGSAPHKVVPLTGNGLPTAPCQYVLAPQPAIEFGNVPPGTGAVLGFRFSNVGNDLCVLRNVHVAQDANGAFFLPGGPVNSTVVWPGDAFEAQVAYVSKGAASAVGSVTMGVSDPANPLLTLPLTASSLSNCLVAAPPFIDFGALRSDCPHPPQSTHVTNACPVPVQVDPIWIGTGTSNEFSLVTAPPTPLTMQPGQGITVTVAYAAQEKGQNFSPLFLGESDVPTAPLLVPLLGEGLHTGNTTDRFIQADGTKADVLFIVDNSNSMAEEQPRLQAAIPDFIAAARAKGMDLHVAVTTTGIDPVVQSGCNGGVNGGEAGRFFPVDHSNVRIVDLTVSTPESVVQDDIDVGLCTHLEQGLEAARRALSSPLIDHADDPATQQPLDGNLGFLRDDAQLSVIVVSDEDNHSGDDVSAYAGFLRSVHGLTQPQRVGFFGLVPLSACATSSGSSAPRYAQMAQATGGEVWDVCSGDYGPALAQVADRSFGPQTHFPLTQPADPSTISVSMNGIPAAAGSWSYDASTNAIVFNAAPVPGTAIDVAYTATCAP